MGKGGKDNSPTQTTSTVTNTNVPEYARPYVENMLGATQQQLFKMDGSNITGFQPYKAYSGTYDEAGNQTTYDPSKAVAGFSPMQQQAMGMASGPEGFAQNVGGYMSPYMQNVTDIQKREAARQSGIMGMQQQAQATQAGAFGGSRDAIQRAERERNLAQQMGDIQAQGSQAAFSNAQQQFNTNLGQMTTAGALQQQNQQQAINQSMQDYANAQQYPLMQLGTMSNMLRGLPMQAQTTQQYQAQANPITQGIGALGAGASLYNATKAEGGVIKGMASGGITSVPRYDVGGSVVSQLATMPDEALKKEAMESPSPRVREMAAAILKQRQAGLQAEPQTAAAPEGVGPMGVDYNANYAGGGIIAFADGKKVDYKTTASQEKEKKREEDRAALLKYPAAVADVALSPARGILNLLGVTAPNISNRVINALAGTDFKTDYGPGYDLGGFYNTSQKGNVGTGSGASRLTTANDPRVKMSAVPTSGVEPVSVAAPAAAPATAPVPAAAPAAPAAARPPAPVSTPRAPPRTPVEAANSTLAASANDAAAGEAAAKQAAASGITAVPPTSAAAGTAPVETDPGRAAIADAKKMMEPFTAIANKTTKELYEQDLADKKALGLDNSEAKQKLMQQIMAERANLADEAYRTNQFRRAQFFAEMASTPGNTLVAGMIALKNRIPDILQDSKDQKLARQQADKAIFDLEESMRLEKLGAYDKADVRKQAAIKTMADLQASLTTASVQQGSAEKQLLGTQTTSAGNVAARAASDAAGIRQSEIAERSAKYVADTRATADAAQTREAAATRLATTANATELKLIQQHAAANAELARVMERAERLRSGADYQASLAAIKQATINIPLKPDGTVDESKINLLFKTDYDRAKANIARFDRETKTSVDNAENIAKQAFARLNIPGGAGAPAANDIRATVEAGGQKYEPDKYDYKIAEDGSVQRKLKGR